MLSYIPKWSWLDLNYYWVYFEKELFNNVYHSVIYPARVDITEWVYFEKELFNKVVPFSNITRSFQETFHKVVILLNGSISLLRSPETK